MELREKLKKKTLSCAYSKELCNIGTQVIPDLGTKSAPKNKNPPPFPLRQWPTTFCVIPMPLSCDEMLALLLLSPRTPAVGGEGCGPRFCRRYPHLKMRNNITPLGFMEVHVTYEHDTQKLFKFQHFQFNQNLQNSELYGYD